ncbi:hypothetical protein Y032_0031g2299 [Ancylostoma ceylanicum]|nr:hypothetical protein Y032_0031g2299 [Ancylostoma ceylanicum]
MRRNGSSWRVEPGKTRTRVNTARCIHDDSSIFFAACGPCVYNCYPSQPQYQYYQPIIYQPPAVVQPQTQSTQQCIGPCVNSQCPAGYTCNAYNVCCAIVAGK